MSNNTAKKIGYIFLVIVCVILGCVVMANLAQKGSEGRAPIRTLVISLDANEKDEFFTQMRQFADEYSFNIYIRDVEVDTGPSGKGFFGEMLRNDIDITIFGTPSAPMEVSISFDISDSSSQHLTQESIDELFNSIKTFLSEIPSVVILEEQ